MYVAYTHCQIKGWVGPVNIGTLVANFVADSLASIYPDTKFHVYWYYSY